MSPLEDGGIKMTQAQPEAPSMRQYCNNLITTVTVTRAEEMAQQYKQQQRTWVQFPPSTWQLTPVQNSSSMRILCPLLISMGSSMHTVNIFMQAKHSYHKIINLKTMTNMWKESVLVVGKEMEQEATRRAGPYSKCSGTSPRARCEDSLRYQHRRSG